LRLAVQDRPAHCERGVHLERTPNMLVLSRRIHERIVMPTVGATVQVVAAKNGQVRIGVEAPDAVPVFREEVFDRLDPADRARLMPTADKLRDQVRVLNEALSTAAAGIIMLRRQLEAGRAEDVGTALDRLIGELRAAQHQVTGTEPETPVTPVPVPRAEYVVI
jgi:carbon storage regulator CsrA